MRPDVTVFGVCALSTYGWMCAALPPIARSAKALIVRPTNAARSAALLAAGAGLLWTMIGLATLFLWTTNDPNAGLIMFGTRLGLFGVAGGVATWIVHAIVRRGVPRIGQAFETATALSIVAIVRDDPDTLDRVEQLYRAYAAPANPDARAVRLAPGQ